ncbi:MAG: hypothetical protein M3077_01180 [Candidatus Dormibacteraeota bacterium]|nr:hypothetical protein [Candidatus Dormibacteraeota bacterium]
MSLNDWAVLIMGGWVIVIVMAGLLMALRTGAGGELVFVDSDTPAPLRQTSGVMPSRAWGFRPPVQHSHYDPSPWQRRLPRSAEDSLDNVDRATEIKRELGSEHAPWERLDRQGL